ncbi:YHS domain-containing (seleno)protein [Halomonas sp. A29]|uniref:YHS domain-containing (seleno)protein n=1 Tax=Halomonas sp. A29 TaxID=3102786 RepID=UPI00398AA830
MKRTSWWLAAALLIGLAWPPGGIRRGAHLYPPWPGHRRHGSGGLLHSRAAGARLARLSGGVGQCHLAIRLGRASRPIQADPEAYVPQYGGWYAWAAARGEAAATIPEAWKIVDGKLYLNFSRLIQWRWERDIPGHIAAADSLWPNIFQQ